MTVACATICIKMKLLASGCVRSVRPAARVAELVLKVGSPSRECEMGASHQETTRILDSRCPFRREWHLAHRQHQHHQHQRKRFLFLLAAEVRFVSQCSRYERGGHSVHVCILTTGARLSMRRCVVMLLCVMVQATSGQDTTMNTTNVAFAKYGDAGRSSANAAATSCPPARFVPPIREHRDLGFLMRHLGFRGNACELGVKDGEFTRIVLDGWRQCDTYLQVDLWRHQQNYIDLTNRNNREQTMGRIKSKKAGDDMVAKGYAQRLVQCVNYTTSCALEVPDGWCTLLYVDARHDYMGVMEDLHKWWPKLADGGIIAGDDYSWQKEPKLYNENDRCTRQRYPANTGQDWSVNMDGSRDPLGRAVRGAVDDFFSGVAPGSPLSRCPRQVTVAYRECGFNAWVARK